MLICNKFQCQLCHEKAEQSVKYNCLSYQLYILETALLCLSNTNISQNNIYKFNCEWLTIISNHSYAYQTYW